MVSFLGENYIYHSILVKIFKILRFYQNWFYSYFGGFKCLDCYYLIVCCSLDPILVIWYVIFGYFYKFIGTFLN